MTEYYWDLTLKDGRIIQIPPKYADLIKQKLEKRDVITTRHHSIPYSEVKGFEISSNVYTSVALLEEASQAFNEPIITTLDDGTEAVKARWVKKRVTRQEYSSRYSKGYTYKTLDSNDDGFVTIAQIVPVHQIDTRRVSYCTDDEIKKLNKY